MLLLLIGFYHVTDCDGGGLMKSKLMMVWIILIKTFFCFLVFKIRKYFVISKRKGKQSTMVLSDNDIDDNGSVVVTMRTIVLSDNDNKGSLAVKKCSFF